MTNDTAGAGNAPAINETAGYLTKGSLCAFLGGKDKPLGKSTINDWIKKAGFPKPIRLSQTLILWRLSEVVTWVEERAAANSKEGAE
ncbi:AlpA family phage regulatory protein [uncultured Parasutterella sp.]|uniref:helix-turn-helix transcriptional regulator n=1 Tax=uncultured Parasutterella sp. TaxID=1263098 RepID=UPI0025B674BE|nr:AlpA family phage regulatory protein [uncultured Parasutterella sp.]